MLYLFSATCSRSCNYGVGSCLFYRRNEYRVGNSLAHFVMSFLITITSCHSATAARDYFNRVICGNAEHSLHKLGTCESLLLAMTMQQDMLFLVGKEFGSYHTQVCLFCDKFVKKENILGQRRNIFSQKVGIFVSEAERCRRFNSHKRSLFAYQLFQYADISFCKPFCPLYHSLAYCHSAAFLNRSLLYLKSQCRKQLYCSLCDRSVLKS